MRSAAECYLVRKENAQELHLLGGLRPGNYLLQVLFSKTTGRQALAIERTSAPIGFSLARTLNTFIGDYKASRESIVSLAAELDATIIQVKELNSFVETNKTSKVLGEGSLKLAEKCTKDSDRLVKRLVELLTKARLPEDPAAIVNIKPEDIVVGRLTRAYWPLVKPQVDVVRSELHVMKTDILLARSCIQAQTGSTPADRAAGDESIVAHAKSLQLARQLLRRAKEEEQRSTMSTQIPDPPSKVPGRHVRIRDNLQGLPDDDQDLIPGIRPPARRSTGMSAGGEQGGVLADRLAREIREDIAKDFERKQLERVEREAKRETDRQHAISVYQESLKEKFALVQARSEKLQRELKETFGSSLDEKQMHKFLEEQQSQQMQDEFGEVLLRLGVGFSISQGGLTKDALASSDEKGDRPPKRSDSKHSSDADRHSSISLATQYHPYEYIEGIVSFNPTDHVTWDWTTVNSGTYRHHPCGSACNLEDTAVAYHAIPQSIRKGVTDLIESDYGPGSVESARDWHLHAAMRVQKESRKAQKLLQKAILGTILSRGTANTLLVYCRYRPKHITGHSIAGSSVVGVNSSASSVPPNRMPPVELSQTDIGHMKAWLRNKGLSASKIAELEARLVKPIDSPFQSGEPAVTTDNHKSENAQPRAEEKINLDGVPSRSVGTIHVAPDGAAAYERDRQDHVYLAQHGQPRQRELPPETEKSGVPNLSSYDYPVRQRQPGESYDEPIVIRRDYRDWSPTRERRHQYRDNDVYAREQPWDLAPRDEIARRRRAEVEFQLKDSKDRHAGSKRNIDIPNRRTDEDLADELAEMRQEYMRQRRLDDELADELAEMRLKRRMRPRSRGGSDASSASGDRRPGAYHDKMDHLELERRDYRKREEALNERESRQRQHEDPKEYSSYAAGPLLRRTTPDRSSWFRYQEPPEDKNSSLVIFDHDQHRARSRLPSYPPPPPPNPFSPVSPTISPDEYSSGRERIRPYERYEQTSRLSPVYERPSPEFEERKVTHEIREPVTIRDADWYYPIHRDRARSSDDYIYHEPESKLPQFLSRESRLRDVQEEASDVEDANLDDEELKRKMLVKYTGGGVDLAAPETITKQQLQEPHGHETSHKPSAENNVDQETSPVSSIRPNYTATVEDIDEASEHSSTHAGAAEQRDSARRPSFSSSSTHSTRNSRAQGQTVEVRRRRSVERRRGNEDDEQGSFESLHLDTRKVNIPPPKRWW
ncbi:hypothetical protein Q7P37_007532 [Cladosporium fusiforme]